MREHEAAGQKVTRISVSGGIARSDFMCEVLATALDRPLARLQASEGPAQGAAAAALAGLENPLRRQRGLSPTFGVADAVNRLVKFREPVPPNPAWRAAHQEGLRLFEERLKS